MDRSWGYGTEQRLRSENQDTLGVFDYPEFTLAVVCDGMGGHAGGAQASQLAVRTIFDTLWDADRSDIGQALRKAIEEANKEIFDTARKNHRLTGMGTTVVACAVDQSGNCVTAHVGDSRAYLIRGDEIAQLTRDHTMVNLFVDAELLSPEDAATHPEAHVLSRSLGVERQVDVEVGEAFPLDFDDSLFLCSDGVHGVVEEDVILRANWRQPHAAIKDLLRQVEDKEGDDNATAASIVMLNSGENVPESPVPSPGGSGGGDDYYDDPNGGVDLSGFVEDGPPPISAPVPSNNDPNNFDHLYQDSTAEDPNKGLFDEPSPFIDDDKHKKSAKPLTPRPQAREEPSRNRAAVLAASAGVGVMMALGVVGLVVVNSQRSSSDEAALIDANAEFILSSEGGHGSISVEGDEGMGPSDFFVPMIAPPPPRLPHRGPKKYTEPPPGGPLVYKAVTASRDNDCATALDATIEGMYASPDHASIFKSSWNCFNETHQRALVSTKVTSWEEFPTLLPHLEGLKVEKGLGKDKGKKITFGKKKQPKRKNKGKKNGDEELEEKKGPELPQWYIPAPGGIEHRLHLWLKSNKKDLMADVMVDMMGEPTVADQIGTDVMIEAQLAAAFYRNYKPDDFEDKASRELYENTWARRVFVVTQAMEGRASKVLSVHRPDLIPQIDDAMLEALGKKPMPIGDDGEEIAPPEVPEVVLDAFETAKGLREAPEIRKPKVQPRKYVPAPEEDEKDFEIGVIKRAEDPNARGRGAPEGWNR